MDRTTLSGIRISKKREVPGMRFKKLSVCLLAAAVVVSACPVGAAALSAEEVKAPSAVLMEAQTGKVLFQKNEHEKRACASITKVMTLLLVMEALDSGKISLSDKVSVSEHAASMGGSQIWLKVGETMSVDELLKATVIASANDCAVVLGEYVAGSEEEFVAQMNQRAKQLGDERHHVQKLLRPRRGRPSDLGLRRRPDVARADEASENLQLHENVDGFPARRKNAACQHQQAAENLQGHHGAENRHDRQGGKLHGGDGGTRRREADFRRARLRRHQNALCERRVSA